MLEATLANPNEVLAKLCVMPEAKQFELRNVKVPGAVFKYEVVGIIM